MYIILVTWQTLDTIALYSRNCKHEYFYLGSCYSSCPSGRLTAAACHCLMRCPVGHVYCPHHCLRPPQLLGHGGPALGTACQACWTLHSSITSSGITYHLIKSLVQCSKYTKNLMKGLEYICNYELLLKNYQFWILQTFELPKFRLLELQN